jgi:NAD(P)-dependent dehydrogenase (short-subunit alcohol dehydrogenase family)
VSQRHRFASRVCLVTGGGRGIGQGLALALAAEGGRVAVCARTAAQREDTVAQVEADGGEAISVELDVTDLESCENAVDVVSRKLGLPSILVNAAGISPDREPVELFDPDAWDTIVDTNLSGTYRMTKACAPGLFETTGAVLNVASTTAFFALPKVAAYGASKAGQIHFTRTVAREWAERGVRVNALCPGYIETELSRGLLAIDHLRQEILDDTPMRRFPEMDEIVAPGLFLLSDEASFITGTWLIADGGMAA